LTISQTGSASLLLVGHQCRSGKVVARKRASYDADVSTTSPKIPYGGFSPVRLQGRNIRRGLPLARDPSAPAGFTSALHALRLPRRTPRTVPGNVARLNTSARADCAALPQGPSLQSELFCLGPSPLIRPHPPHSQAHLDFIALRLIRDAFAVRTRLGDPRVVPCFRCAFLLGMPPSTTAGSPSAAYAQFLHRWRWPSPTTDSSALPRYPSSASDGGVIFAVSLVR